MYHRIAAMLHDLNNKLAVVMGTANIMSATICEECPNAASVRRINTGCESMDTLIQTFRKEMALTAQEEVPYPIGKELSTSVGKFIKETAAVFNIAVEIDNRLSEECQALGSTNQDSNGKSIIHNCMANAANAGATSMRIVWVEQQDYISVHFIDNGWGMDQEEVERAGIVRCGHSGTSIIKRLAYEMGGMVSWMSAGKGAGTTVTVRIPKHHSREVMATG